MYGRVEQHQGCYSEWSFNGVSTCTFVLNSIKAVVVSGVAMVCLHVRSC